jgi:hypothetical protein
VGSLPADLSAGSAPVSSAARRRGKVVTANRLRDGVPVYFCGGTVWSPAIGEGAFVAEETGEILLSEARQGKTAAPVIAPYVIDAEIEDGIVTPVGLRERIRAFGPTV